MRKTGLAAARRAADDVDRNIAEFNANFEFCRSCSCDDCTDYMEAHVAYLDSILPATDALDARELARAESGFRLLPGGVSDR